MLAEDVFEAPVSLSLLDSIHVDIDTYVVAQDSIHVVMGFNQLWVFAENVFKALVNFSILDSIPVDIDTYVVAQDFLNHIVLEHLLSRVPIIFVKIMSSSIG